jgi:hypothetical protein
MYYQTYDSFFNYKISIEDTGVFIILEIIVVLNIFTYFE